MIYQKEFEVLILMQMITHTFENSQLKSVF